MKRSVTPLQFRVNRFPFIYSLVNDENSLSSRLDNQGYCDLACKVRVKLLLYLTKHGTMKPYGGVEV